LAQESLWLYLINLKENVARDLGHIVGG